MSDTMFQYQPETMDQFVSAAARYLADGHGMTATSTANGVITGFCPVTPRDRDWFVTKAEKGLIVPGTEWVRPVRKNGHRFPFSVVVGSSPIHFNDRSRADRCAAEYNATVTSNWSS
jgi:hypothetical protein